MAENVEATTEILRRVRRRARKRFQVSVESVPAGGELGEPVEVGFGVVEEALREDGLMAVRMLAFLRIGARGCDAAAIVFWILLGRRLMPLLVLNAAALRDGRA